MVDQNIYPPTPEQQRAIDAFSSGRALVLKAGAGTGKTTTLAMCARTTPRTGAYMAFNKAVAQDASMAMPGTVQARTVHSFAAGYHRNRTRHGAQLLSRLDAPRMAPWTIAKRLGITGSPIYVTYGRRTKVLQPGFLGGLVMKTIDRFCQSADPEPTTAHVPYVEGIDLPDANGQRTSGNNRALARELIPWVEKAWDDVTSLDGELRFTPDVMLKMAQLADAPIPGDYILLDEAQDANPVILAWLAQQEGRQIIYVGDAFQQIYEWRGAVNALDMIPDVEVAYLTQSWRFGQRIADAANLLLAELGSEFELIGNPAMDSRLAVSPGAPTPKAVLCRSNAAAVETVLNFQSQGLQPHLVGGAEGIVSFARAAAKLQAGEKCLHPDLGCFESWAEVREYVDDNPQGDDLRMMVNLLEEYGVQIVLDALDGLIGEREADVIVSTAHKAKGREWPIVRLAGDFGGDEEGDRELAAPELRLLYVAATRARDVLDVHRCQPLLDLVCPPNDVGEGQLASLWGGA
jgi:hypothetical protein